MGVTFSQEEVEGILEIVDQLSGGNASNVFSWNGKDDINCPITSAFVKIFKVCGQSVPENLTAEKA